MAENYKEDRATLWKELFQKKFTLSQALGKIRDAARITVVSLNCAPKCNLRCKHCFYNFEQPHERLLTFEEWRTVINEFLDLGVRHFHISGREPLSGEITFDILKYLCKCSKHYDLNYGLITNGILVSRVASELLQANLNYLDFSIDGEEKNNDFIRGKGVFEKALNNLSLAFQKNLAKRIYVSSVAHKNNYYSIINMIKKLSQGIGIRNFFIQPLQIHGRARKLAELALSSEEYVELTNLVARMLMDETTKNSTRVVMLIPQTYLPGMLNQSEFVRRSLERYFNTYTTDLEMGKSKLAFRFHITCLAFWRTVQITPDGYYLGCGMPLSSPQYYRYAVGNVARERVLDLYHKSIGPNSLLTRIYNDSNLLYCKDKPCFHKCFGGCRISTHIETGSWSLPSSSCLEKSIVSTIA